MTMCLVAGACTVMEACPVCDDVPVAVTVTMPAVAGAVKRPAPVMMPAVADQVTAESAAPLLWIVALHCDVPPVATVEGLHTTESAEADEPEEPEEDVEEEVVLEPLPQDVTANSSRGAIRQQARLWKDSFLIIETPGSA